MLSLQDRTGPAVVFEDEHVVAVWSPGPSDHLLVTFGDMIALASGHRFFADGPALKSGLATIGFMARRPNWFPASSMSAAIAAVADMLARYDRRIGYGGSMGGYAVLKYSGLLGLTHAVALCPQWSIDKAECGGVNPGWIEHFRDGMQGMGIRPNDVAGEIVVFADLGHKVDDFHASMIQAACPRARVINVPLVGHHVTSVFAGTKPLMEMLSLTMAGDVAGLRRFGYLQRRRSKIRLQALLQQAHARHPAETTRWLIRQDAETAVQLGVPAGYVLKALASLLSSQGVAAAMDFIRRMKPILATVPHRFQAASLVAASAGEPMPLCTAHGTSLVYDLTEGICAHGDRTAASPLVSFELIGDTVELFAVFGANRITLGRAASGALTPVDRQARDEGRHLFTLVAQPGGSFALTNSGFFLSAERGGAVRCNRREINDWERFGFLPR